MMIRDHLEEEKPPKSIPKNVRGGGRGRLGVGLGRLGAPLGGFLDGFKIDEVG